MNFTNIGTQTASQLANAAIGQGSTMADLEIQQGNIAAQKHLAGAAPNPQEVVETIGAIKGMG